MAAATAMSPGGDRCAQVFIRQQNRRRQKPASLAGQGMFARPPPPRLQKIQYSLEGNEASISRSGRINVSTVAAVRCSLP